MRKDITFTEEEQIKEVITILANRKGEDRLSSFVKSCFYKHIFNYYKKDILSILSDLNIDPSDAPINSPLRNIIE